ncbi:MAG: hypothetical protein RIT24_686 [Planctomycetota bacterium]
MTALPLLFWIALLAPGWALARRLVPRELEGGILPSLAVAWMTSFIAMAPVVIAAYIVRIPTGALAALVAAFIAWGFFDLLRARAWRRGRTELARALIPIAGVAGVVVIGAVWLADRHGAILDNDSRVHVARVRHLAEFGLSNIDPFVRTPVEYPYPIYHTNLLHALAAVGSVLLGIDPVTMWFNSLAFAHLLIAASVAYLAWAALGGTWAPWVAAAMVIVNRGPYPFTIYPNQLAPWALMPIALAVLVRVLSPSKSAEPWSAVRAACALAGCATVIGMFHPLYAGFTFVVAAPVAGGVALWRTVRRAPRARIAWVAAVAIALPSLAFPLASRAMTARGVDANVPRELAQADDGMERGDGAPERGEDEEAAQLGTARAIEAARARPAARLVRPQEGFTFYERGDHDWIGRTFGRGFTGGWSGIPAWRLWLMAAGIACALLMAKRREALLVAAALGTVLAVMSVPPLCTAALKALGAQWILGRFEMVAFVLWIPLSMPAIAAGIEASRRWPAAAAWWMQGALAAAAIPVAHLHASQRPPYTWTSFESFAMKSEGVRNGRQHSGLLKQKAWMDEAIPEGAVVLAGPLTGTWIAMLHGAGLVASERSSTGIASGRVRRSHIDEMFSPETEETRRAELFGAYRVTHVLTRGRAPSWTRYWTSGGNRRHGHIVLTLRPEPDAALLWMREIEVARGELDRGKAGMAIERLQALLAERPRAVEAWFTLGNAQSALGDREAAVMSYLQAESIEPDDPVHALMIGNAHAALGQFDDAIADFERCHAIALRQNDQISAAAAQFNRGNALYRRGRVEDALAAYEAALELDPRHGKAQTARGWIRQDLGLDPPAVAPATNPVP